ncbi:hypothetical protein [Aquimarina litoralis]|uniref:hypothetical protein n=1 Tax=Aquimarina litoralis TaxID=584605 RepID=UPI001C5948F8|nr:hypothetical protein [Aquimarina litoralis]MBW1297420.1 hypothetical protein [Aquimarina litoralis]
MKHKLFLILIGFVCSISCTTTDASNERFFIPKGYTKNGIVNKYYVHTYPKDKQITTTSLEYSSLKKVNDSTFQKIVYNPAFKIQSIRDFSVKEYRFIELGYKRYFQLDSLIAEYPNDLEKNYLTFKNETVSSTSKLKNKDSVSIEVQRTTKFIKDTTILSKPAKIVAQNIHNIIVFGKTPRDTMYYQYRNVYVQDLGLYSSTLTTDSNRIERILVEQILPEEFDTLSDHNIERVGYIDFDKTIDKELELELCLDHQFIADYYNGGNDRAGFIGGKGNLKKLVYEQLDTTKLKNESGYLTFRFVINCKGKAGKFITNEADFDYNEKQFDDETRTHLYEILSSVKQWKPCVMRNTARDSYFYVTFILKNGKIEDILP